MTLPGRRFPLIWQLNGLGCRGALLRRRVPPSDKEMPATKRVDTD